MRPAAGGLELADLTLSSGEAVPPIVTYPRLQPERTVLLPARTGVLVHTSEHGDHDLLDAEEDVSGALVLVKDALSLALLALSQDQHLLLSQHDPGSQDSGLRELELPVEEEPETLFTLAGEHALSRTAIGGKERGARVVGAAGSELLWRLDDGHAELLTPRPLVTGPTLGSTPGGALAFSVGAPGAPALFVVWKGTGGRLRLQPAAEAGFVLPGV